MSESRHAFPPILGTGDWTFDERVAEVFPDMIQRFCSRLFNISLIGMPAERFVQPARRCMTWAARSAATLSVRRNVHHEGCKIIAVNAPGDG